MFVKILRISVPVWAYVYIMGIYVGMCVCPIAPGEQIELLRIIWMRVISTVLVIHIKWSLD